MYVRDLMTKDVAACGPDDRLNHAAQLMWNRNCGCVPVVDDEGYVIAMITDRDVCMAAYTQGQPLSAMAVRSAMSTRVVTCAPSDPIRTAEMLMRTQQLRRLPVVSGEGKLVGILSLNDLATQGHFAHRPDVERDGLGADAVAGTLSAICGPRGVTASAE